MENGYVRVAAVSFDLQIANTVKNGERIVEKIKECAKAGIKLAVFPELCITGYTCADLFYSRDLLRSAESALADILDKSSDCDIVAAVGLPVSVNGACYNCAAVFHRGRLLACVPKSYIPNSGERYEGRYFSSAFDAAFGTVSLCGQQVFFGSDIILKCENLSGFNIAFEICDDLWAPHSPAVKCALAGATVIGNLSAGSDFSDRHNTRALLASAAAQRLKCAYIYSSSDQGESSTDLSFSGDKLIAVADSEAVWQDMTHLLEATIDIDMLLALRGKDDTFKCGEPISRCRTVPFRLERWSAPVPVFDKSPFCPERADADEICAKIFGAQAGGLARRMGAIGINKAVVGVSGGLDSTLALLVSVEAMRILGLKAQDTVGVTMPGFGTGSRTYHNGVALIKDLGCAFEEMRISDVVAEQLRLIGHDFAPDTTYENTQARQRTQLLMNYANKIGGLVVGTGDLSEIAIGFSTYNGDHMSMYSVNSSVPKTMVRKIIGWYAKNRACESLAKTLEDVLNTAVSPELLPPNKDGSPAQLTESIVGSYEVIDFVLYYHVKYAFSQKKLTSLALAAFEGHLSADVVKMACEQYFKRFYANQFKRSCMPDGVKATSISLSPRGELRLPSDLSKEAQDSFS